MRPPGGPSPLASVASLLRIRQWHKNAVVLAGLLFGDRARDAAAWRQALLALLACCLVSSAGYVLNDLLDREADRAHPRKRLRPLASKALSPGTATGLAFFCLVSGLLAAAAVNQTTALLALGIFANTFLYSLRLKHVRILDLFSIALNFVLRVMAGVAAVAVPPSGWILLCTFFLALFLAAGKRFAEVGDGDAARPVLGGYTAAYLRSAMTLCSGMAIVTYALYTILSRRGGDVVLTVPLVAFALLHQQARITVDGRGADPSEEMPGDRVLLATLLLWAVVFFLTSGRGHLFLRE